MDAPSEPEQTALHPVWHRRAGDGPTVALLHGFTQTGVSWRPVVELLLPAAERAGFGIVTIDLPGHGDAPPGLDRSDLWSTAAAVVDAVGPAIWVGYSMGGRLALRIALDRPGSTVGLVVIGATAGIDDPDDRAARRRADDALARSIEDGGVPAFLDRWLAQPLFAELEVTVDDRAARAANRAAGLAGSLRAAGTGTMDPPWWDELHAIDVPTTVVAGELDSKFSDLGSRIVAAVGGEAELRSVPGTGHAVHLQRPDLTAELISAAVARCPGGPSAARVRG